VGTCTRRHAPAPVAPLLRLLTVKTCRSMEGRLLGIEIIIDLIFCYLLPRLFASFFFLPPPFLRFALYQRTRSKSSCSRDGPLAVWRR
jgi:hypothetical protein